MDPILSDDEVIQQLGKQMKVLLNTADKVLFICTDLADKLQCSSRWF